MNERGGVIVKNMNLIAVYDPSGRQVLMCKRRKNPYLGLYNLIGGKIEPGEDHMDAAYRELWEETGITREDVTLTHFASFSYPTTGEQLEWYVGQLSEMKEVFGDENDLEWISAGENFFDMSRFAGEGNIGHVLEEIRLEGIIRRGEEK